MRFLPKTREFYKKTFKILIICDVLHFALQNIFAIIQFLLQNTLFLDNFLEIFCLFLNVYQLKTLLKSLNFPFNKENFLVHKQYFSAKLCFLLVSLLKLSIYRESLQNLAKVQIFYEILKVLRPVFFVECLWIVADLYFLVILQSFLMKMRAGIYDLEGGTLICWENLNEFEIFSMKNAIIVEIKGENVENCGDFNEKNNYFKGFCEEKYTEIRGDLAWN